MITWLVISAYRNDEHILRILDQVDGYHPHLFERILIVDSEGTGIIPRVLEDPRWAKVIYRSYEKNLGSGANLCERLRTAAEGGADYAYALNHDGCFDPKVVPSLLKTAGSIENLGAGYPLSYLSAAAFYNVTGTLALSLPSNLLATPP